MRTKATWQKGHSLLPLAVELEPLEVAFMVLRLHFPDMASKLGAAIEPSLQSTRCRRSQVTVPDYSAMGCDVGSGRGDGRWLDSRVRVLTEGKGRGRRRGTRVGNELNDREGAAACNTQEGHRCPYGSHVRLPRPDSGPEQFTDVDNGQHQQHPQL